MGRRICNIISGVGGILRRRVAHARGYEHGLALLQPLGDGQHLLVEPLHTILAAHDALHVLVVDEFGAADVADERAACGVHELEDVQGGIRLVALGTDVALVVQILPGKQNKKEVADARARRTFRKDDLMILYILATRHLTTLQKCW